MNTDERLTAHCTDPGVAAYALRCEVRAVEKRVKAHFVNVGDGPEPGTWLIFSVRSTSQAKEWHTVAAWLHAPCLWVKCTCASGTFRDHLPIPCIHAAAVARRLERQGHVKWADGAFLPRTRTGAVSVPAKGDAPTP